MEAKDLVGLIHPVIAIVVVFPLIGMVVNFAWQTRQRRLESAAGGKSKIPPVVGPEHLKLGLWLSGSVVGVTLIALAYVIFSKMLEAQTWSQESGRVTFVGLMFVATIASLVLLYRARHRLWRGVFATLTGMGLILLGSQPEIYRRGEIFDFESQKWFTNEWYVSHYYIGIAAALLMIFSLAIIPEIYKDRSLTWRRVHVVLNCIALLLFIGQGVTGTRDLLEIPLSWQKPFIYQCDFTNLTCPMPAPPQSFVPDSTSNPALTL
jgi:hypothetical protein